MSPSPPRPLSGLRVLDLTRVLAGPYCGMILADLGADVIKVERPGRGDDTRGFAPPYVRDRAGKETGESAYYLAANRGKRSLSLDLARPEGQALARRLALKADVLIENFKVGDTKKFAMAYDDLKDANPRLIYCSVTGFGQTGPYARRAGYDAMIQAMGGIMSVTGLPDGQAGAGPMRVGVPIADLSSGLFATIGILAALQHRHASGRGQHVDIGLLDVQVAMLANQAMNYLATGKAPGRIGNAHPNIVPYQMFATADDFVVVAVGNDQQYERFCAVLGRPDLGADPRFAKSTARVAERA
ncbi:MAG: CoA transferase, partial [Alphaproteobacteria bacterium]|nr:CoA transferase [Alphaproteobacteria bacterium]